MVTDLEKRLQIIRRQVYGKDQQISYSSSRQTNETTDLAYFYQDLLKILILSSLAIGAQLVLFVLSQNHILNLNFF
ncbi:hypothetical protein HYU93_02470 [Candidatus Daviesbacteria bacterium]|nr:hypothetical protein [Candidatus Daviesbacteria bacterium]